MSVITVSRGSMSGGKLIAEKLAKDLGFRCIDRDVIVEKAAASGVSQDELSDAMDKPPTFLERFRHKKYIYLALMQAALTEEVKTGRAVYQGNAGHLLLKGEAPVLRVRIIAPLEFRIAMARQRLRFSRDEAIAYITKMDQARRKWTYYLYGVDWGDPALYDIVVNLEQMDVEDAGDTIAHLVRRQACFEYDANCQARMEDLAVASRVRADLALNSSTEHLEFEVTARNGAIAIRGRLSDTGLVEEVERVASGVAGVTDIRLDELMTMTQA